MRWKSFKTRMETAERKERERLMDWHKIFAWIPTRIGEEVAWLEPIHRKIIFGYGDEILRVYYRFPEDKVGGTLDY